MAKEKADLLQGTLDLLVLKSLQLEPQHGFAIAQRIQQLSSDVLRIEQGSLYPALYRLEERGWIERRLGHLRQQPQGQVLRADANRPPPPRGRGGVVGAAVRRGQPGAAGGRAVVSAWRGWLTRMRRSVRRDRFEAEMADELRTHLEMEAEARQARGAAPDAARREAAIAFGHVESLKESVRDRRAGQWLAPDGAGRALRRPPAGQMADLLRGRHRHDRARRRRHRDDLQRVRRGAAAAAAVCGARSPGRDRRAPRRRLAQLRLGRCLPRLAGQRDAPGQRRAHGRRDRQPAPRPRRRRSPRRGAGVARAAARLRPVADSRARVRTG